MNKPNNYDNVQLHTDPVALGGHHAIIMEVKEKASKNGAPMVAISIDFANSDIQPRYFSNIFKADTREAKKWPYNATLYMMVNDNDGNASRNFKGFITASEESNGMTVQWGIPNWGTQFKGRKIGVVYGEEEDEYKDELRTTRRIRFFCKDEGVEEQTIPKKKEYKPKAASADNESDFMQIPEGFDDSGLPFN